MRSASERRLRALEAYYEERLLLALKECAQGRCDLFGQNDAAVERARLRQRLGSRYAAIDELLLLGAEIEDLRRHGGYSQAFGPHARLLRARSVDHQNSPGEAKLAQRWLDELTGDKEGHSA